MTLWMRFDNDREIGFGSLEGGTITVHHGDMFTDPTPTSQTLELGAVTVLTPTRPSKMLALWNNFRELATKLDQAIPEEPLYFIKPSNTYLAHGGTIRRPKSYDGPVVYEGELGIVIGAECSGVSESEAEAHIFGYTCINDVTAARIIDKDPSFQQWVRAKGFDTFGAFGPVVATGLDPETLRIKTVLNGQERQNYLVSDMIIKPRRIVSMISQDMTLYPGDVICCGTSLGVGSMKAPRNTVEITIEGIGTLANIYE